MKTFRFVFPLLALSIAAAHGQQFDNPVTVPVAYYGSAVAAYTPPGYYSSFSFGASLGSTCSANMLNPFPGSNFYSNLATAYIVPGQTYNVTVTSSYTDVVVVYFQPVDGCEYYINGNKGNSFSAGTNYTFTLRVEKINDITQALAGQRGGAASSLPEDKPIWYVGLGSLRNGRFAGAVGFRQPSISSNLYNTSSLIYESVDPSEVSVSRDGNGYITQIQSRDVVLTTSGYNPSGTSYTITAAPTTNPGSPFATYTISQYTQDGGAGVRIDKSEDNLTWSTAIEQNGDTWTQYPWQQVSGQGASLANAVVTTLNSPQNGTSTVNYGGGEVVKQKSYTTVDGQTELASTVMGPGLTAAPTTTYAYYSNSGGYGFADAVQSVTEPTGNWTVYDYYNAADSSTSGLPQYILHPWQNAPSTPGAATFGNCEVESYTYTTNYDGSTTAPQTRQLTVNGIQTGQTSWSYNWNYATVNSHTIAQVVEQDYSSSADFLSTTSLVYREDDPDSFFHGRAHSVTKPDGTKDSYAYFYGTWDPNGPRLSD